MRRTSWLLIILLLVSLNLIHRPPPTVFAADSPVLLSVFSEDSSSSNLVDPSFIPGSSFNITIIATNLPPMIDQNSGGLSGFDVILNYNSSIIRAGQAGFDAPFCRSSDGCILDMPQNDTVTVAKSLDVQPGIARLAMVALGPSHRAVLPTVRGQQAILFRIQFNVVGKGLTSINIDSGRSQLLGFNIGCGTPLSFTVANGSFDNRAPFRISASAPPAVARGGSVTMQANVSLVNSVGNGNVSLVLSGIVPIGNTPEFTFKFTPSFGILNGPMGVYSFVSNLQISVYSGTPDGTYPLTIIGVIPSPASNAFQYNYNFTLTVSSGSGYFVPYVSGQTYSQPSAPLPVSVAGSTTASSGSLFASFTLSSSPALNHPVTFTAVGVWCGSPSYTLRWDFGDGFFGATNPANHTYVASGTYTVTLTVTDNGTSYTSSQAFTINSQPSHAATVDAGPISGGIVLALLIIGTFLFLRRRRKSPR